MTTKNEITNQIETLVELYLDTERVARPPVELFRLTISGDRVYYYFDEDEKPVFKQAVSTVIRSNTPTSPFLMKWYADMGWDAAHDYVEERAGFGTFMHKIIEDFLINRHYDLDRLDEDLEYYCEQQKLPISFIAKHSREAKKALMAFVQFYREHNVDPVAVEMSLPSYEWEVAGMMDLVCEMDIDETGYFGEVYKSGVNKGKPKKTKETIRIRALIDFKSGKNFYPEHAYQLELYRMIWNEHFPDFQVDRIFNWAPNDWTGSTPTYKFKEQTNAKGLKKLPQILIMNQIDQQDKVRTATILSGTLTPEADPSENIETISYRELIKKPKAQSKSESDEK